MSNVHLNLVRGSEKQAKFHTYFFSKMAPAVKLTYFDLRGLAELLRMLMKYVGQEFEDKRISFDEWPKLKPAMPFGQLPLYEENGKSTAQSIAIARYLAKKAKLTGKNEWEDLMIDSMVDTINDVRLKIVGYFFEQNADQKAKLKEPLFKEIVPFYFDKFEKIAKENGGYLACGRLTWVDFQFASLIESMCFWTEMNLLEGRPNLEKVKNNVFNLPAIKDWVSKRPKTNF